MRSATRKITAIYDQALSPLAINVQQYSLLRIVQRRQPASLTDLGQAAELERSTVSRNVRVLERMGLVLMGRGGEDRREAVVALTDNGASLLDQALPLWEACQRKMEADLGAVKITALQDILHSI